MSDDDSGGMFSNFSLSNMSLSNVKEMASDGLEGASEGVGLSVSGDNKKDKNKYLLGKDYLSIKNVLNVIDFLISNRQKNITGQNIIVDSGFTLC